jgi:hypothetical protein
VYYSLETYPAATEIGIQQMQITRTVDGTTMVIDIKQSTDEELIAYIEACKQEQLEAQQQIITE